MWLTTGFLLLQVLTLLHLDQPPVQFDRWLKRGIMIVLGVGVIMPFGPVPSGWWFMVRTWVLIGLATVAHVLSQCGRMGVFQDIHRQWDNRLRFLNSQVQLLQFQHFLDGECLRLPRWMRFQWGKYFFVWVILVLMVDHAAFFAHLTGLSPGALAVRGAPASFLAIGLVTAAWAAVASCYNTRSPSFPVRIIDHSLQQNHSVSI